MKRLSLRKVFLYGLGLLGLAGLVYAFMPEPAAVDLAVVSRGRLRVTVDQDGRTRIKDRYVVSAPLLGQLSRVELKPGAAVEGGKTVLALIEPCDPALLDTRARAEAEARVRVARSNREQAEARLEHARVAQGLARSDLERARRLSRTASREELDNAEHKERMAGEEYRGAQFALRVSDYEIELAEAAFLRTKPRSPGEPTPDRLALRAPVSGRVLRVHQESAATVPAGTKLLEIGDPGELEVEIDVLSQNAVKVRPGAKVFLEHWGGEEPLEARVRLIEPSAFLKVSALGVEEQRVWVIADLTSTPEKQRVLGDGYRVEARIVVWEKDDVLKVSAGALFRQGDSWGVYVIEQGRAVLHTVQVGQGNGLEVEVLDGLSEGEQVIIHPSDRIKPGAKAKPRAGSEGASPAARP
jgi:HlyD family secretion protein